MHASNPEQKNQDYQQLNHEICVQIRSQSISTEQISGQVTHELIFGTSQKILEAANKQLLGWAHQL